MSSLESSDKVLNYTIAAVVTIVVGLGIYICLSPDECVGTPAEIRACHTEQAVQILQMQMIHNEVQKHAPQ